MALWTWEHWHVSPRARHFALHVDRQALVTLLGFYGTSHRLLWISRWSARLLYYNFTVECKKGAENYVVDALSALPFHANEEVEQETACIVSSVPTEEEPQEATLADPNIRQVVTALEQGSWQPRDLPRLIAPLYRIKGDFHLSAGSNIVASVLSVQSLCTVERVQSLIAKMLETADDAHPGIRRTKQRLRELHGWPVMDPQLKNAVHNNQARDKRRLRLRCFNLLCFLLGHGPYWERTLWDHSMNARLRFGIRTHWWIATVNGQRFHWRHPL